MSQDVSASLERIRAQLRVLSDQMTQDGLHRMGQAALAFSRECARSFYSILGAGLDWEAHWVHSLAYFWASVYEQATGKAEYPRLSFIGASQGTHLAHSLSDAVLEAGRRHSPYLSSLRKTLRLIDDLPLLHKFELRRWVEEFEEEGVFDLRYFRPGPNAPHGLLSAALILDRRRSPAKPSEIIRASETDTMFYRNQRINAVFVQCGTEIEQIRGSMFGDHFSGVPISGDLHLFTADFSSGTIEFGTFFDDLRETAVKYEKGKILRSEKNVGTREIPRKSDSIYTWSITEPSVYFRYQEQKTEKSLSLFPLP